MDAARVSSRLPVLPCAALPSSNMSANLLRISNPTGRGGNREDFIFISLSLSTFFCARLSTFFSLHRSMFRWFAEISCEVSKRPAAGGCNSTCIHIFIIYHLYNLEKGAGAGRAGKVARRARSAQGPQKVYTKADFG